ncbi:MAG: hypothetical protein FWE07_07485 [Turicibacter sp.]|nr:hypothetical protein [Turicibacter sp.]
MSRTTKKFIVLLVEGITEENALAPALKEMEASLNVRFKIMDGDPFTDDDNKKKSSKNIIGSLVATFKKRYKLQSKDIAFIAQLTDADGVFVEEKEITIAPEIDSDDGKMYELEMIKVRDAKKKEQIHRRNRIKKEHLIVLSNTNEIASCPFQIFYFSRNLEHVLFGTPVLGVGQDKSDEAWEFSETYASFESLKEFFHSDEIKVDGYYDETWDYIKADRHSLERNSNFHLLLEWVEEEIAYLERIGGLSVENN